MNKRTFHRLVSISIALVTVLTVGCRKNVPAAQVSANTASENTLTSGPSPRSLQSAAASSSDSKVASVRWSDLQEYTFDSRAEFFAGLQKLEARVDAQIQELNAKRATMNSTINTKDWDFAMKEMASARAYLKATGDEARKATPDIWNQQKDKVGEAWARTQEAYDKVNSSTTI